MIVRHPESDSPLRYCHPSNGINTTIIQRRMFVWGRAAGVPPLLKNAIGSSMSCETKCDRSSKASFLGTESVHSILLDGDCVATPRDHYQFVFIRSGTHMRRSSRNQGNRSRPRRCYWATRTLRQPSLNLYMHAIPDSQRRAVNRGAGVLFSDVLKLEPDSNKSGSIN